MKLTEHGITLRTPRNAAEMKRLADVLYQSFAGFGREYRWTPAWLDLMGRANCRVALRGREIVAGLGILHFAQYFGGRPVSAAGISAVGVAAEARGGGVGTAMMRATMEDLHRRGCAISVLYPSTYALYRKAGFEPAGARIHYRLSTAMLGIRDHALPLVTLTEKDIPRIRDCYEATALHVNGQVQRSSIDWKRILSYGAEVKYAYGVPAARGRALDGYVIYIQRGNVAGPLDVLVRDAAARNIGAIRRLLTFFVDHATMAEHIYLEGGPAMPLLTMAREEYVEIKHRVLWMVRILDVSSALLQRGYSPHVSAEVHFEVDDDLFDHNAGRFVLRVDRGRASVKRGGDGRLRTSIRGLAPLFTGHLSAQELSMTDLLSGDDASLTAASAIFAGSAPWMNDRF